MRKTFANGQAVEIQRDVGAPWESATYDKPRFGQERSGWHIVNLLADAEPRIVAWGNIRCALTWVAVPSVRLRAKRGGGR